MRNLNKTMTSLMLLVPLSSDYALDPIADRQALADLGPGERTSLLQLAGVPAVLLDEIRAGYQQQVRQAVRRTPPSCLPAPMSCLSPRLGVAMR